MARHAKRAAEAASSVPFRRRRATSRASSWICRTRGTKPTTTLAGAASSPTSRTVLEMPGQPSATSRHSAQGSGEPLPPTSCSSAEAELQGLAQSDGQGLQQLLAAPFLTIHARHLFGPTDPPAAGSLLTAAGGSTSSTFCRCRKGKGRSARSCQPPPAPPQSGSP